MYRFVVCLTILFACSSVLWANCDPCSNVFSCSSDGKAIEIDLTYTGGVFGNVHGGKRTGSTYMGLAEIGFTGDSKKLGLWKNGTFFVSGFFSHGPGITRYVGDYQDPVYFAYEVPAQLCEYWYTHRFFHDRLAIRVGKADSSSTFFHLESQEHFVSAAHTNVHTPHIPADPENAWGIVSTLELRRGTALKFGIHDEDINANSYTFPKFKNPCYAVQLEKQYTLFGNRPGFVYVGSWYDTDQFERYSTGDEVRGNYGFSAGIDQMIWKKHSHGCDDGRGIFFFSRLQTSARDRNELRRSIDTGLTYRGFFDFRPDDVIGIGCSTVRFSPEYRKHIDPLPHASETALECFYKAQLSEHLIVQPDFQYIFRPGGEHPNATVLGLAFRVAF